MAEGGEILDVPFQKISNAAIEALTKLDRLYEEQSAWLNSAYEVSIERFSRNKVTGAGFPQTPKVARKNRRKRKRRTEEKENEIVHTEIKNKTMEISASPSSQFSEKSKTETPSKVKEHVKLYEEKTSKMLLTENKVLQCKQNVEQKSVLKQKESLKTETVYITTLSPVLLNSPERFNVIKNKPVVVISPLKLHEPLNDYDEKMRNSILKPQRTRRSSVVNTLIRAGVTRPSLRRSSLLLSKIRASMRLNETPKAKIDPEREPEDQETKETENKTSSTSEEMQEPDGNLNPVLEEIVKQDKDDGEEQSSPLEIISRTPTPPHTYNKKPLKKFPNTSSIHRSGKLVSLKSGLGFRNLSSVFREKKFSINNKKVSNGMLSNCKFLSTGCRTPVIINSCTKKSFCSPNVNLENELKNKELMKIRAQKEKEVLRRREEILKRKIEERKRKREEREQRVQECKEERERKQLEQKEKLEREYELKERIREENMCREAIKRSQRLKMKNMEREKIRKQEEELRKQKLKQKAELLKLKELRVQELAQKEQERIARERAELERVNEEEKRKIEQKLKEKKNEANDTFIQEPTNEVPHEQAMNKTFNVADKNDTCQSYHLTPEHTKVIQPLSNPESYDISHLCSDESTDDEYEPRKPIPAWAQSYSLSALIISQACKPIDLDKIFPPFEPPDLSKIFKISRKRFYNRTSSAVWTSPVHSLLHEYNKNPLSNQ